MTTAHFGCHTAMKQLVSLDVCTHKKIFKTKAVI